MNTSGKKLLCSLCTHEVLWDRDRTQLSEGGSFPPEHSLGPGLCPSIQGTLCVMLSSDG